MLISILFTISVIALFCPVFLLSLICCLFLLLKNKSSPESSFFKGVFGHRGAMNVSDSHQKVGFPENSLSAFHFAFRNGADGIEFDIQLTKDSKIVVFHDSQTVHRCIDPLPGGKPTMASKISQMTLQDVKNLRLRNASNEKDCIPTLKEVVKKVLFEYNGSKSKKSFKMMIEVKEFRIFESIILAFKLSKMFETYPTLYNISVVGSFNPLFLYLLRKVNPRIITNLLYWRNLMDYYLHKGDDDYPELELIKRYRNSDESWYRFFVKYVVCSSFDFLYNVSMWTWIPDFIGAGVFGISSETLLKSDFFINFFRYRGYEVNTWGVSRPKDRDKLLRKGVSVTTDNTF